MGVLGVAGTAAIAQQGITATTSFGIQMEREEVNLDRTAAKGLIGGTPNIGSARQRA